MEGGVRMNNLYKTGDTVKIIKNNYGGEFDFYVGMIGNVKWVYEDGYRVEFEDDLAISAFCNEDEIELV